jgi:NADH-quinone oxidoreductase subunit G
MGLALMGGRRLSEAFSAAAKGAVEAAVVVENDLYRRAAAVEVAQFLDDCPFVVAVDHTLTPTVAHAAALLPAATWAESTGTLVSHDGRAQRYAGCLPPREQARESWRWLALCMEWAGRPSGWDSLDDVLQAMADELPQLAGARDAMPGSTFRTRGMKVARLSRRSSGRTAVHAPLRMVEPAPPADPDSPLAYSMEGLDTVGAVSEPPASLTPRYWAPGWSSAQALNKFQEEVGGPLRADHSGVLLLGSAATSADSRGADSTARAGAPSVEDALSLPGVPPAFVPSSGRWLVVPLHHIFGSEELSALAPAVAERVPPPYLALSDDDARSLFGCDDDGLALLEWGGYRARLPVRRLSGLPGGIAGVPVGLPGMGGPQPPFLARITPEVRTEEIGHA